MRKVGVEPYKEEWIAKFNEEKSVLHNIFEEEVIEIHHIGSTSVEGLPAKPVIDVLAVVRNIRNIDNCNRIMESIGYDALGENGIVGRRYFQKGGNNRTHHLHIFECGSPEIERHLAFRDYLRCHHTVAQQYGELKLKLSHLYPYNIDRYIKGKEQLVQDIEKKALPWYRAEVKRISK